VPSEKKERSIRLSQKTENLLIGEGLKVQKEPRRKKEKRQAQALWKRRGNFFRTKRRTQTRRRRKTEGERLS